MGRLRVRFICDSHYKDWNSGDVGYVDGYCRGGDGVPCDGLGVFSVSFYKKISFFSLCCGHWLGLGWRAFDVCRASNQGQGG